MNPDARASFRQQIDAFLASDKYRRLMIDFEDFAKSAQPGYVALLGEMSADLHAKGLKLYVSVPARDRDFDYAKIASLTDGLVLMNYDEHESQNDAGRRSEDANRCWHRARRSGEGRSPLSRRGHQNL